MVDINRESKAPELRAFIHFQADKQLDDCPYEVKTKEYELYRKMWVRLSKSVQGYQLKA